VRQVKGILSSTWQKPKNQGPYLNDFEWVVAGANLNKNLITACLTKYCRRVLLSIEELPKEPYRLGFSLSRLGDVQYIVGITIQPTRPPLEINRLGYSTQAEEEYVDIPVRLAGFHVAACSTGIQGIQCVMKNGQTSKWIGETNWLPITRRLTAVAGSIKRIGAGFDVRLETIAHSATPRGSLN
jgi:hypothetical protein